MRRFSSIAVCLLACSGAMAMHSGCVDQAGLARLSGAPAMPPPPAHLPMVQPATQASDGPDLLSTPVTFRVICDIMLVDAPAGAISANPAFWRHINEDVLGDKQTDHLARNGLRVGRGKGADFNEVSRVIANTRDAKGRPGRLEFQSDSAMDVMLNAEIRQIRAFVFDTGGGMAGDEYPAGVTLLWIQAWHDTEHMDSVNLTLVPEIRYGRVRERYYAPIPQAADYKDVGRLFEEVRIRTRQNRGEFLVIAPDLKAQPPTILGRALLTDPGKGQERETVILLRPRVVQKPTL